MDLTEAHEIAAAFAISDPVGNRSLKLARANSKAQSLAVRRNCSKHVHRTHAATQRGRATLLKNCTTVKGHKGSTGFPG